MGGTYPTTATVPRGTVSHQPHPQPQPQQPEPPALDLAAAPTTLPHPYSAPDGEPCHHRRPVLREIPLDQITVTPGANPRTQFDEDQLQALAASIERDGLLQPIVVRPGPGPLPSWILITGERRLRAARLANLTTLPALIRGLHDPKDPREQLTLALVENLHRADLNAIDEARALTSLYMAGVSQAELGRRLGRAAPTIANSLRLVTHLPKEVQDHITAGRLSAAHGRALARYHPYTRVQQRLATWAIEHQWSSHLVEGRTLPNGAQLTAEGLAASPWTHAEPWATQCHQCPHGAYLGGYCLRPDHDAALRQQHQEAKRQQPAPITPAPHTTVPPPPADTVPRAKEDPDQDQHQPSPATTPLSPAGRAWAIEQILSSHQDRWLEQLARDAPDEAAAIKAVRQPANGSSYRAATQPAKPPTGYRCHYDGITVEAPDGTTGRLTWLEVTRTARAAAGTTTSGTAPATAPAREAPAREAPAREAPTPEVVDPRATLAARRQATATKQAAARAWINSRLANPRAPLQLTLHQERAISLLALLALRPMHRDALHAALGTLRGPHRAGAQALIKADLTDLFASRERFHLAEHLGTTTWLATAVEALLAHEADLDPANTPWADWLIDGQAPTPTTTQE